MKNVFVVPNPKKDTDYRITAQAVRVLLGHGAKIFMPEADRISDIAGCDYVPRLPELAELIIVIGGDGSFIDAAQAAIRADIPILGINLGKVGYLSEIEPEDLTALGKIFTGEYKIDEKTLLNAITIENGAEVKIARLAVNDIVISHTEYLGIADFVLYSKDGGVRYRADGMVVSTPQGSTAYSLSAGGPVVSHGADVIIATPIAPHSFFNRSIVFSSEESIKLKNISGVPLNVSIDGRFCARLLPEGKCTICISEKKLKVMTFKDNSMFSNLFSKMQILEDII